MGGYCSPLGRGNEMTGPWSHELASDRELPPGEYPLLLWGRMVRV